MNNNENSLNQINNQNNITKKDVDTSIKFFIVFKLIMSIFYFIPSFFIFGIGLILKLISLIIGYGVNDTDKFNSSVNTIQFVTSIPVVLAIIVLILAIVSCVKCFKNKYSKIMDLIVTILFIIVNIFYIVVLNGLDEKGIILSLLPLLILITIVLFINTVIIIVKKN